MDAASMAGSPGEIRHVVSQWQRATSRLAEVRRQEVSQLTDADADAATLDLLASLDALPQLPPRATTGLVEQQRWFLLARRA